MTSHRPGIITALILLALAVLAAIYIAATVDNSPPRPSKQQQVAAYLSEHGLPDIAPEKWQRYEDVTLRTCDNDNPYYFGILGNEVNEPEAVRAGISVYCPDRLNEWDRATD
jgi:hypothetical protein